MVRPTSLSHPLQFQMAAPADEGRRVCGKGGKTWQGVPPDDELGCAADYGSHALSLVQSQGALQAETEFAWDFPFPLLLVCTWRWAGELRKIRCAQLLCPWTCAVFFFGVNFLTWLALQWDRGSKMLVRSNHARKARVSLIPESHLQIQWQFYLLYPADSR